MGSTCLRCTVEPPPQPQWQLETCEEPDKQGRKSPITVTRDTSDALAIYFNFTTDVDFQVALTTCVNPNVVSSIDPVIRVFDHAPLAEVGSTLSPGDVLAFNVRFDRFVEEDRFDTCVAFTSDFHEAYLEFDVPANTPRYVMVDGLDGTSGPVSLKFRCFGTTGFAIRLDL